MGLADFTGRIKVDFTGTGNLIQISSVDLWVESFMVEPDDDNANKCYIGKSDMVVASKIWHAWLPPPSANFVQPFSNKGRSSRSFNLKLWYLAGTNLEGATVSYNIA